MIHKKGDFWVDDDCNKYISCEQLETGEWEVTAICGYKYLFSEDKKTGLFNGYWYKSFKQLESGEYELTYKDGDKKLFTEDKTLIIW